MHTFKPGIFLYMLIIFIYGCEKKEKEKLEELKDIEFSVVRDKIDSKSSVPTVTIQVKKMSMYNENYTLKIISEKHTDLSKNKSHLFLLKAKDTVVEKTITIDTIGNRYWEFYPNPEGIIISESYYLREISEPWVRANNLYLNAELISLKSEDTLDVGLKFIYRGKDKNKLWINVH